MNLYTILAGLVYFGRFLGRLFTRNCALINLTQFMAVDFDIHVVSLRDAPDLVCRNDGATASRRNIGPSPAVART
jgi:hypothetical protein